MNRFAAACAAACTYSAAHCLEAHAQTPPHDEIVVTGRRIEDASPAMTESVTGAQIDATINAVNTEDALKYLPDILIRKRHIGDTQAPMTTRTSGLGSSARSLIYADGMLLSALIGNNNSTASPKWGMVPPDAISRIDVLYGPFAAVYSGNSIGAVVNISTRMPEALEASVKIGTSWQNFSQYGTSDTYPAVQFAASAGDRDDNLSWRVSVNHLDAKGQPLAYVTAARPQAATTAGTPVTGAFADVNRTNGPIVILGAGGIEHHVQDTATAKLAYDLSDTLTASYTFGYFRNDDDAHAETYLRDGQGAPVYAGNLNVAGGAVAVPPSAFSNNAYTLEEEHWMQGASLTSDTGDLWDFAVNASVYSYAHDLQRSPATALPAAAAGGAGALVDMAGTGWYTADAKIFRHGGAHELSGGVHRDGERLISNRYNAASWTLDDQTAQPPAVVAHGLTTTDALWLQDAWRFAPFILTLGGRFESWRAIDGYNFSATPALSVAQPNRSAARFSPKASLTWEAGEAWTLNANFGVANRFPTVSELYQAVTTGAVLTVPNPDLAPERAISTEVNAERAFEGGKIRISLFQENIADALISQSAPLVPGSATLFNYVQNIDATRARGAEITGEVTDVGVMGLSFQGSVSYVDARITEDPTFPGAIGKRIPQVPAWRWTLVATYKAGERWTFTAAARGSTRVYATTDNSDGITHTYQGFDGYMVADARVRFALDHHWSAAAGIDNLGNRKYFLFHPFPQRSVTAEVKYTF